ncbi:MAG: hypothetical protein ACYC27_04140 [Armatimonadota bacterium]
MNIKSINCILGCICFLGITSIASSKESVTHSLDIKQFSLPNCKENEVLFEEPRDISRVVVTFTGKAPEKLDLYYMHKIWPQTKIERNVRGADNAIVAGWEPIEDWFNCDWRKAEVNLDRHGEKSIVITFKNLVSEFKECTDYDVTFRRTQGIRIQIDPAASIANVKVYTTSQSMKSSIRVSLDTDTQTKAEQMQVTGYNAIIDRIKTESGKILKGSVVSFKQGDKRSFTIDLRHMKPSHRFCNDGGNVTFTIGSDAFTISMESLMNQGPIWYADEGVYITLTGDRTSFEQYKAQYSGKQTISRRVLGLPEQSLGGALNGQPRSHPDSFVVGCKNARQRFRIEPTGDLVLAKFSMDYPQYSDTPRFKNNADARFFFGLERWEVAGRYPDTAPIMAYNIHLLSGDISMEQKSFAVPLLKPVLNSSLIGDDTIVGLVKFTFTNTSDHTATAELPVSYSSESGPSYDRLAAGSQYGSLINGDRVPPSKRDKLTLEPCSSEPSMKVLTSVWQDQKVIRCAVDTTMQDSQSGDSVILRKELKPGETCAVTLKIPYISLAADNELKALAKLNTDSLYNDVCTFWRGLGKIGAEVHTPEPRLDALYKSHFAHVSIADHTMPNDPDIINTSVGSSIYANYANESCMIVKELDERGLHEEARRRLSAWLKYQGTAALIGNFTDQNGVFFGTGGFEAGNTYNQHHGWVLWCLSEHYFTTRDDAWMKSIADQLIKGADWVFRQRKNTMVELPHSRGWEYGFLPAGSLEDVSDYFYWLSTNSVTWRGVDSAAQALEAIGHPEAARIRREADEYRKDLIKGFEKSRQNSPLVKLKDGRWIPHYPSRLYLRGRDIGWIREVLEGSVYLLISGLYDENSKQAAWILDDYQDNRYISPDYGYPIYNPNDLWYDVGGFSCQPNLLAGLMPYLDRDEPELYIWMFFNAWAACYREETGSMVEHPFPVLGHSNIAIVKTSDQSNAVKWLRYMYVYAPKDTLFIGWAIPREWLSNGKEISAEKVSTRFGDVSVRYHSEVNSGVITLNTDLALKSQPGKIIARIRHPEKLPIKSVMVNGQSYSNFDAVKGDIDITGLSGNIVIEARY